jgi:hypothetical protein
MQIKEISKNNTTILVATASTQSAMQHSTFINSYDAKSNNSNIINNKSYMNNNNNNNNNECKAAKTTAVLGYLIYTTNRLGKCQSSAHRLNVEVFHVEILCTVAIDGISRIIKLCVEKQFRRQGTSSNPILG